MVALREDLRRAAEQHQTSPVNKRTLRVQLEQLQEQFQKELAEKGEEHERALEAAKEAEEKLEEMRLKLLQLEEQLEEQHAEPWICWFAENKLFFPLTNPLFGFPSCSMYGIVTYIYPKNGPVL